MRARAERFGAIVALDDPPALVSVDRVLAARLGIAGQALWSEPSTGLGVEALTAPTEAHVAVTGRCGAGCASCYMDATPDSEEPSREALLRLLDELAAMGVFRIAFGGGEPLLRDDLAALAEHTRALGMVPTLTTSGFGMTGEHANDCRAFAQVNVSYDGSEDVYAGVRGYSGARAAERAIDLLVTRGVRVGVNTVLTRCSFPPLAATAERAASMGASELQLLRLKPSGRGRLEYPSRRLTSDMVAMLPDVIAAIIGAHLLVTRIDCSLVPFLAHDARMSASTMERFGVMGCEGGRSLLTVGPSGAFAPCSFWADDPRPATSARRAWVDHPVLLRWRAHAVRLPEPCAGCHAAHVCRGGCRVVSREMTGNAFAPDPECPHVQAEEVSRNAQ